MERKYLWAVVDSKCPPFSSSPKSKPKYQKGVPHGVYYFYGNMIRLFSDYNSCSARDVLLCISCATKEHLLLLSENSLLEMNIKTNLKYHGISAIDLSYFGITSIVLYLLRKVLYFNIPLFNLGHPHTNDLTVFFPIHFNDMNWSKMSRHEQYLMKGNLCHATYFSIYTSPFSHLRVMAANHQYMCTVKKIASICLIIHH